MAVEIGIWTFDLTINLSIHDQSKCLTDQCLAKLSTLRIILTWVALLPESTYFFSDTCYTSPIYDLIFLKTSNLHYHIKLISTRLVLATAKQGERPQNSMISQLVNQIDQSITQLASQNSDL